MGQIKTHAWKADPVSGVSRSSGFAEWAPYLDLGTDCSETETTFNHARLSGGRWSGGGPWDLWRNTQICSPSSTKVEKTSGTGQVKGTARMGSARISTYPMAEYSHPTDVQLNALGTTAIARTEPTNPSFDLSVFLGELRAEGLPNLPGSAMKEKTRLAKSAGSEYLNVEFGWLPLVRGLRDFANTVDKSDQITRSYQEQANKVVQRSYEWPIENESHAEPCSFNAIPGNGGTFQGGGRYQHRFQKKWFEVEYVYYLPTGNSMNDKIRRFGSYARKLYGIDISPEVLWNLAPWSWAADWFANTGDVMHNISALGTDGLVMRNGYVMCHTRKEILDSGNNTLNGKFMTKHTLSERKTRRNATPYGFGLLYNDLTSKQKAVIAALGMSRW
jgi:hypothetical protein